MASLDSLPPDQRAVLQLVLQRGRSYDEIAKMLSIDRAGVRERALQAFDALGPTTRVPAERRALITDYLLGQLPPRVADDTRDRLGESASERAWARVIASELSGLTDGRSLPEIPVESVAGRAREPVAARNAAPEPAAEEEFDDDEGPEPDEPPRRGRQEPLVAAQSVRRRRPQDRAGGPKAGEPRPSSRRGGAIVLGVIGASNTYSRTSCGSGRPIAGLLLWFLEFSIRFAALSAVLFLRQLTWWSWLIHFYFCMRHGFLTFALKCSNLFFVLRDCL